MAPREEFEVCASTVSPTFKVMDKVHNEPVVAESSIPDSIGDKVEELEVPVQISSDEVKDTPETPTKEINETTDSSNIEVVTSSYMDRFEEMVSSFRITQFGIRLSDSWLSLLESPAAYVSTWMSTRVKNARRHLRAVRRAGERRGGITCTARSLLLQMVHVIRFNFVLGLMGVKLVDVEYQPESSKNVSLNSSKEEVKDDSVSKEDDEDSDEDPDFVPSSSDDSDEDSLEYRSETEFEQDDMNIPTTPNYCAKVENVVCTDGGKGADERIKNAEVGEPDF